MRRIFLTSEVIQLSQVYYENLFIDRRPNFEKPINNNGTSGKLFDLENHLLLGNEPVFADYVHHIIVKYDEINILLPNNFENYQNRYFNLSELDLATKIPSNGNVNIPTKELYKLIVDAMRYDAVRDKEFLPYVKKIGVKSCIYCNAQFAITTDGNGINLSGRYELDHFYPKSKYPFLSTSFFNLQPCCSHCNKTKTDKSSLFGLYTDDYTLIDEFSFSLDKKSMIHYLLTQTEEDLKIIFNCNNSILKDNHEDLFHISELYNQHKDVVEEIIWKAKIYNKSYKESLSNSFSKFFPNTTNFNRFIIGNYDNPNEIHRRPLAKLVQDIAKQLGVI